MIYSLPDARLIKTFGRAGEGPGEFFTIAGEKIYQLIENEDTEEWELHINKI